MKKTQSHQRRKYVLEFLYDFIISVFAVPKQKGIKVDIDLSLSAYSNARRYYDQKKQAARKEQKTADASYKVRHNF